jgi:hypothetical protein
MRKPWRSRTVLRWEMPERASLAVAEDEITAISSGTGAIAFGVGA